MNEHDLRVLLSDLIAGKLNADQVVSDLKRTVFRVSQLEDADLDHHRELRCGTCEVVYGEGKSVLQLLKIATELSHNDRCVLITRLDSEKLTSLKQSFQGGRVNEIAGTFILNPPAISAKSPGGKFTAILSAGTSDLRVAEEAAEVCIAARVPTEKMYDVGVSGLHRLLRRLETIQKASIIIVVAGMEGALPSVVGGLVGCPVIAVPTSVGYGTNFRGLSALLGMLNSCGKFPSWEPGDFKE